ncbi:sigma-70 family RNA polymerase sigma factor [Glycomyces sp. NRRL B-16210]|uniref:sigma-70 family RNA polymerase sigma factor n=1 Tax=Glycomyces sp. NRRL B-16210 TaxID=1463821 RepID=UPI0004C0EF2F|nr:sigma-70 family RNA polymerase sigma factor [Glycomyces sp. NRRL B-16210]
MNAVLNDEMLAEFEPHRRELCAYAYRMLGSSFEAEDAVQEAFTRAWKAYGSFEGRASLRSWLYKITTNVCLDMIKGPQRRARPMDLAPASDAGTPLPAPEPDYLWVEPIPDSMAFGADPAAAAEARDTLRLAFVAAVQHLPAKQRAVMLMREVLRFSAAETAEMLQISPASVNSALQRARATMEQVNAKPAEAYAIDDEELRKLIDGYVSAFEAYDLKTLTALCADDVAFQMPPFPLWVQGHDSVEAFLLGTGSACRGSKLVPVENANGHPAFGHYKPSEEPGLWTPWSVTVLEIAEGKIAGLNYFLDTPKLFPLFGLPMEYRE